MLSEIPMTSIVGRHTQNLDFLSSTKAVCVPKVIETLERLVIGGTMPLIGWHRSLQVINSLASPQVATDSSISECLVVMVPLNAGVIDR